MKWYTMMVIAYITLAGWVWIGTASIPPEHNPYVNISENQTAPYQILEAFGFNVGNATSGEVGPSVEGWMTANTTTQSELMTTSPGGVLGIAAEGLSAFLGAFGAPVQYIIGFINAVSSLISAMTTILSSVGIPQPWAGLIGGIWNIMFILALVALITGRDI